ncbi:electron transport complex protein RnfC [Escherichia coli]|uniref:Electron transport complex protein RnfC n=1 Tax=Escherichia coli TaxID=562 RepID=A0A376LNI6_ECOLX|nr:electron transport complex protein RnfC [Escherichia coli]
MGLPEQYSPGAIFPQEKAEIAAIRQEEKRAAEPKRVSKRARLVWSAKKRLALNDIRSAAVQPAAKDKDAIAAALARVKEKQARLHSLL